MAPEQVLEQFQNLAQYGGVEIYPLDDSPSTESLVEQIVKTGGHRYFDREGGKHLLLDPSKPLVIVTNAYAGYPTKKEASTFQKKISASFISLKEKLSTAKLDLNTPIFVIGLSKKNAIKLAKSCNRPILFLGKMENFDRPVLASKLNDEGSGMIISCVNLKIDKTKSPEIAMLQYIDKEGYCSDIEQGLILPNNQVQQEQLMGGAGATMQEPGLSTAAGAGSVDYGGFVNAQHPQDSLPGYGSQDLLSPVPVRPGAAGLEHSEHPTFEDLAANVAKNMKPPPGFFDTVAPGDCQDPMSRVPSPKTMQRLQEAMEQEEKDDFHPNAPVTELGFGSPEDEAPGKTPRPGRRSPPL